MTLDELLPPCPVFILMAEKDSKIEKLQVYSSTSQSCADCKKNDAACDVYLDWLGTMKVTQLATYRDVGTGV